VLNALVESEAQRCGERPVFGDVPSQLAQPVQEIVKEHETESDGNREQIEQPDVAKPGIGGHGAGNHVHRPSAKAFPASGWHLPQVVGRLALAIEERGSLEGRISCTPWQLAQLATVCEPAFEASP